MPGWILALIVELDAGYNAGAARSWETSEVRQIIEHMWFQRKALLNGRMAIYRILPGQLCNPIQFPSRNRWL